MTFNPASASAVMYSIFASFGIVTFSFCRPSRGPTSTTFTESTGILISTQSSQYHARHRRAHRMLPVTSTSSVRRIDGVCFAVEFEAHSCSLNDERNENGAAVDFQFGDISARSDQIHVAHRVWRLPGASRGTPL